MLGGISAVIWNDVIQFCIMFGGLGATVWIALHATCRAASREIWTAAAAGGQVDRLPRAGDGCRQGVVEHVRYFFMQPITLPSLVVTMVLGRMASYTSDQVMVQRFQTTRVDGGLAAGAS